jgi:hypothetical protein
MLMGSAPGHRNYSAVTGSARTLAEIPAEMLETARDAEHAMTLRRQLLRAPNAVPMLAVAGVNGCAAVSATRSPAPERTLSGSDAIGLADRELSLQQIRNWHHGLAHSDPPRSIAMLGAKSVLAHQPFKSMLAAGLASLSQIQNHARCAMDAVIFNKGRANHAQQPRVLFGSVRYGVLEPLVVATGRNLGHLAQGLDRVLASMASINW